jgi:hypothetical protein
LITDITTRVSSVEQFDGLFTHHEIGIWQATGLENKTFVAIMKPSKFETSDHVTYRIHAD